MIYKIKNIISTLFAILLIINSIQAQTIQDAKKLAYNGQRSQARELCKVILNQSFDSDVAVLMARTYSWDGKYDSARIVINEVLSRNALNYDALDAISDIEYWNDNYEKALSYCDRALNKDPKDVDFLLKKAKILKAANRNNEASAILVQMLKDDSSNTAALQLLEKVRKEQIRNKISLGYTFDYFDKNSNRTDPWHLFSLQYGRKTPIGTVIGRVNMANRFNTTGYQYELDAYPKISENNYLYLNGGYSDASIFPKERLGIELYHSFPYSFEGSAGARFLFFGGSPVKIYTGSVGKYYGNYWFSIRPFVTPSSTGTSVSGLFLTRRYFSDPEDYIGIRIGYGSSPDDRQKLYNPDSKLRLKSQSFRLEYNHLFNDVWILNTGATYSHEEFTTNVYSSNFSLDISVAYLF